MRQSQLQCYNFISKSWRNEMWHKVSKGHWNVVVRNIGCDYLILGQQGDIPDNILELAIVLYEDANFSIIKGEIQALEAFVDAARAEYPFPNPRDRHTIREMLDLMHKDIEKIAERMEWPEEIQMKVLTELKLGQDNPVRLFGAVILNKDKTRVTVIMPPRSIGPNIYSTPVKEWEGEIDERLEVSDGRVRYSTCRLPLALWDATQDEDANMERLFRDQLGLESVKWERKKLDWRRTELYRLPKQDRDVTIELYEFIASEDGWHRNCRNSKGWPVVMRSFEEFEGGKLHIVFEGALEKSSMVGKVSGMDVYL
ncbi:hypothetical protein F5Y13DRAFT_105620 [Hypoxylon sp. FL1857]|nr:hypothetical protein F5Y13DRAFT_105620 [Hypoxylon sp. FL1857]